MSALYLHHFGLAKPPFQITPDIDFFFSGSQRGDILTALIHVACHEEGIVTAVAEVGSGKTLLARLMLSRLPGNISTVYLANPCFSRDEIISAIARDLGLADLPASIEGKLAALHQELLNRHAAGQRVLLVIDEAHAMPVESLEEVRLLSNLETSSHKLVNIMLFGQPELDELLSDRRLRQVRDRVIHRFELPPLPPDEGAAYVDHRLRTAGWQGGKLFTAKALALLLKASGGRARRINLLADKSLLAAYAEGRQQVEIRHVKSAILEMHSDPASPPRHAVAWRQVLPLSLGLAAVMTGTALWLLKPVPGAGTAVASAPATVTKPVTVAISPQVSTNSTLPVQATSTTLAPAAPLVPAVPQPAAAATASPPNPVDKAKSAYWRTSAKMAQSELRGFTLQISSLPGESGLMQYIKSIERHIDLSKVFAHNRTYGGKTYVAIYLGDYATESEARSALNHLPKPLKADQPIIRTWTAIAKESKP